MMKLYDFFFYILIFHFEVRQWLETLPTFLVTFDATETATKCANGR